MTYNFDPDKWYDMEKRVLDRRFDEGDLDPLAYDKALDALDLRYEAMHKRLDGSYEIPK